MDARSLRRYLDRRNRRSGSATINDERRKARLAAVLSIPFTPQQLAARLSMFPGCWMCGGEPTGVDHVIPIAHNGPHCLSNLRPACKACNSTKGSRTWRLYT